MAGQRGDQFANALAFRDCAVHQQAGAGAASRALAQPQPLPGGRGIGRERVGTGIGQVGEGGAAVAARIPLRKGRVDRQQGLHAAGLHGAPEQPRLDRVHQRLVRGLHAHLAVMEVCAHRNADPWHLGKRRAKQREHIEEVVGIGHHHQRDVAQAGRDLEGMAESAPEADIADLAQAAAHRGRWLRKDDAGGGILPGQHALGERMRLVAGVGHHHAVVAGLRVGLYRPFDVAPAVAGEIVLDDQCGWLGHRVFHARWGEPGVRRVADVATLTPPSLRRTPICGPAWRIKAGGGGQGPARDSEGQREPIAQARPGAARM